MVPIRLRCLRAVERFHTLVWQVMALKEGGGKKLSGLGVYNQLTGEVGYSHTYKVLLSTTKKANSILSWLLCVVGVAGLLRDPWCGEVQPTPSLVVQGLLSFLPSSAGKQAFRFIRTKRKKPAKS